MFKGCGTFARHMDIASDNHIAYYDILEEGYIENGDTFVCRSIDGLSHLPEAMAKAREVESRYSYSRKQLYRREGD
jgi:hypothetical protein